MKKHWTENNFLVALVAVLIYALITGVVLYAFSHDKDAQEQYMRSKMQIGFSKVETVSPVQGFPLKFKSNTGAFPCRRFSSATTTRYTSVSKQISSPKKGGINEIKTCKTIYSH